MIRLKSRECLRERLRRELANCVKCGTCMAFCPVYRLERTETANMRGRLALLQSVEAGRTIPADAVEA
ncbi:4Fe-4S dicluster domain-containing protein, partial [Candidatus Ozemobacteraceae bacterium]|nr:4Fe-4S dicluster domain-containing protein [Candidatus Ozemobacteraceae bacterium]